ncbi:hypothetical protein ACFL1B_04860 [Nanoarchaeota archaeon]
MGIYNLDGFHEGEASIVVCDAAFRELEGVPKSILEQLIVGDVLESDMIVPNREMSPPETCGYTELFFQALLSCTAHVEDENPGEYFAKGLILALQGKALGVVKLASIPVFLAARNLRNSEGNHSLIRGAMYSVDPSIYHNIKGETGAWKIREVKSPLFVRPCMLIRENGLWLSSGFDGEKPDLGVLLDKVMSETELKLAGKDDNLVMGDYHVLPPFTNY